MPLINTTHTNGHGKGLKRVMIANEQMAMMAIQKIIDCTVFHILNVLSFFILNKYTALTMAKCGNKITI